jgi:hypothetical protein
MYMKEIFDRDVCDNISSLSWHILFALLNTKESYNKPIQHYIQEE